MPRNSSGNYTLPTGNPVVTDTLITAEWGNTTMNDLGNEITNSLPRSGTAGMTGPLNLIGNASADLEAVPLQQMTQAINDALAGGGGGGGTSDPTKVNKAGDTMTGQLKGLTPVAVNDMARKDYVDTKVPLAGGTMTGQLKGLTPIATNDMANKLYVDNAVTAGVSAADTKTVPLFKAHASSAQSITSGVVSVVSVPTDDYDIDNWMAGNRFNPKKAGYYFITGQVNGAATSGMTQVGAGLRKNSSTITKQQLMNFPSGMSNLVVSLEISDIMFMNGSTDYVELIGSVIGTSPQFYSSSSGVQAALLGYLVRAT